MITTVSLDQAIEILGHPLGRRKTDDKLAMAAVLGHLGRPGMSVPRPDEHSGKHWRSGSLSTGFDHALKRVKHGNGRGLWGKIADIFSSPALRTSRRWRLPRAWQLDQNGTPQCVAYTFKHWERSLPIANRRGLEPAENYRRAKAIDGAPNEDGTWAEAMLRVYEEQGLVESSWWWRSPADMPAANEWLLHIGGLAWGAYWPESMFRTVLKEGQETGLIEVSGDFKYGHETFVIGWNKRQKRKEIVQSWGNDHYGIHGRAWIQDEDFDRLMAAGGDLVGVVEKRA